MDIVNYLAQKNNVQNSLRAINSAILSGVTIVIGYTNRNLRYGYMAENFLHIGGRSIAWPIGYADPETVAKELHKHAENMGKTVNVKFAWVAEQRGQLGCTWWAENSHLDRFNVEDYCLAQT